MSALRISDQRQLEEMSGIKPAKPKQNRSRKSGHKHSQFIQDAPNPWPMRKISLMNATSSRGHFTGRAAQWYTENGGGNEMAIVVAALDNLIKRLKGMEE